jgi:parvulin-like peptidyl-prolyl isomerase
MPHPRTLCSLLLLGALAVTVRGQQPDPPPPAPVHNVPGPDVVAAVVNDQKIPELAVYRVLLQAPEAGRGELRPEVINFLVNNALVDQYLDQMKVVVEPKELDAQVEKVKGEIKMAYKDVDNFFKMLHLTEAELRTQVYQTLRWDKFLNQYATDDALKKFHEANKCMFDGSQVRARHILVAAKPGDAAAAEPAKAKLVAIKKAIEEKVAKGLAEAGNLDNLELQKKRLKLLEDAFADAAKDSDCPSKNHGGELFWFPRIGGRVSDQFAAAAFAMKVGELSDPVSTEFGWHLILVADTKPGVERRFEDLKEVIKDVYADRMREAVVQRMRPVAKISISPAPK